LKGRAHNFHKVRLPDLGFLNPMNLNRPFQNGPGGVPNMGSMWDFNKMGEHDHMIYEKIYFVGKIYSREDGSGKGRYLIYVDK
jgi:hypothetical protein